MSCEICGRGGCTKSFHSFDEQSEYDEVADKVKDRVIKAISDGINRLSGDWIEMDGVEKYFVDLDDVNKVIDGD